MAIRIAKLASHNFIKPNIRTTFFFSRPISNNFTTRHPDDDFKRCDQEYKQWCNGGGMFHKSARIDPTARIEIDALVHSESTVGACLHWVRKHCWTFCHYWSINNNRVRLAANSCVTKNITEAGDYGGFPAIPIHEWRKQVVSVRQTSKEFWYHRQMKSADKRSR